jgi:hypothetical protein
MRTQFRLCAALPTLWGRVETYPNCGGSLFQSFEHRVVDAIVLQARQQIPTDWQAFGILKKMRGVAIMGGCAACGRKFFTPLTLFQDAVSADAYLRGKFSDHECHIQVSIPEPSICPTAKQPSRATAESQKTPPLTTKKKNSTSRCIGPQGPSVSKRYTLR